MQVANTFAENFSPFEQMEKNTSVELYVLEKQYERQQQSFQHIMHLIEIREELEERITAILSDYTQMINQVSLVSTLCLGISLQAFGSLLGNTDDQVEWKVALFTISCVGTAIFSIFSVLESFFLSIHINQVEARFASGLYPHVGDKRRKFNPQDLRHLNSTFNFIVVTFFVAFVSFSTTILGSVYIGLGWSNSITEPDERLVKPSDKFYEGNETMVPLNTQEPNYVVVASTLTSVVIIAYSIITYRFFTVYADYIHAKSLMDFIVVFGCQKSENSDYNLKEPIQIAATKFNHLQGVIHNDIDRWRQKVNRQMRYLQRLKPNALQKAIAIRKKRLNATETKTIYEQGDAWLDTGIGTIWKWTSESYAWINRYVAWIEKQYGADDNQIGRDLRIKEACLYYAEALQHSIQTLEQFKQTEEISAIQQYSYEREPCARVVGFFLVIWSVCVGVPVTLFLCVVALLWLPTYVLLSTINAASIFAGKDYCNVDNAKPVNIIWLKFRCISYLFKKLYTKRERGTRAGPVGVQLTNRPNYLYKKIDF